jgi:menaquinone-specific isochorismate synthase
VRAPPQALEQLKLALSAGLETLAPLGSGGVVSLLLALPRVPTRLPRLNGPQFYFRHIHRGELLAGYGVAAEWSAEGPDRLRRLAGSARQLRPAWRRCDPDQTGLDAFAMLGFAATADSTPIIEDHLPNALFWIPEVGIRASGDSAALVFSADLPVDPEQLRQRWTLLLEELVPQLYLPVEEPRIPARLEHEFAEPDRSGWVELVDGALGQIDRGDLQKVVLSRRLDVTGTRAFDVDRLLGALSCLFPSCQVLSLRRNGSSFVAATPERLLSKRGRDIEVDAIAGTARRDEDVVLDAALAEALRASEKNQREHRFVIDAIRSALVPFCDQIEVPAEPELMQLSNAQHLWTRIQARADREVDVFELAERLHPTPATNGQPRHAASNWLHAEEPFQRGWYTGAAGAVEPDLSGDLWVLLRCARVCGARAELYAGAGIVCGSDSQREWEETQAKLNAMLIALQYA